MSDRDVGTLLRDAAAFIEPPDYIDQTRVRVRRARRRRVAVAVGLAAATAVGATVVVAGQSSRQSSPPVGEPTTSPTQPTATTSPPTAAPLTPGIAQPSWTSDRITGLDWLDVGLPRVISGEGDGLPALSSDPVGRAVAAVEQEGTNGTGVLILGADGGWRRLDVDLVRVRDEGGYSSPALNRGALSQDGTLLAIAQPQALIVVDLTTGEPISYDVPGLNESAVWPDDGHVLVTTEERAGGSLVDLASGAIAHVPYNGAAAFTDEGDVIEIAGRPNWRMLTYPPGAEQPTVVEGVANLGGSIVGPYVPAIADESVVVGITDNGSYSLPRGPQDWGGVLVLDRETGDPVALLPMHDMGDVYGSSVVGWLADGTVLIEVPAHSPTEPSYLIAWSYSRGDLYKVSELESHPAIAAASLRLSA